MSKFIISLDYLKLEDLDSLMEIEKESYGEHHWSRDSFVNELNNKLAMYYSAKDENGNLIGYIGVWNILEETHITTISVHKDFRRKHIAETLILKMLANCYENFIKYITLEVRAGNISAIKLYEKYGLKSLGTRKGYYQDNGEDALIMWSENIFSDKFKEVYNRNKDLVKEYLIINDKTE